jgi:hypothetical protein
MTKTMGIICLAVCALYILWVMFAACYSIVGGTVDYRFDGVRAAEGTTFTVKNGQLELVSGSHFSVDTPLRRRLDQISGGLCFLTTLLAGITLLRTVKIPAASEEAELPRKSEQQDME